MKSTRNYLPWIMWTFPLVFFGFQFILRLFPGLVMSEFFDKYHLSAKEFGFFASLYYLGYAGMQIPMALLLEKYGSRKVLSTSVLICGLATLMFVLVDSWSVALMSRFLIGASSVVGFLGASKVISSWFPPERYSRMVGLTFSFGLLGAVYGGRPVSMMIDSMGWEKVCFVIGFSAIVLALFTFLCLREKPVVEKTQKNIAFSFKELLSYRGLIILAFANFLMVGSLEGFADVWGVKYLMMSQDLSKAESAGILSFIFVGMLFGGPILVYFADKFKASHLVTLLCGVFMAALLFVLLMGNGEYPQWCLIAMMLTLGVLCCYQVIVFAIGSQLVPTHLLGLTVAFLNCINMLGGAFFHNAIGLLLDFFEPSALVNGEKIYSLESYTYTLLIIPIASLLGSGLVWWSKLKQQKQSNVREAALTITTT